MEFRILGPLEVLTDGRPLDLGGHKQTAVLALLVLAANQTVSRDGIIDALWEDDPPESAHKAVQVYVSGLRKVLGSARLETRAPGYRAGRQADALEAYRAARSALVEELGIEPSRQLRELHQAILAQDPGLDLALASAPASRSQGAAFVGRVAELAELVAGLDDAFAGRGRLFLLGGEPGIGKSRLAEELIARAGARAAQVLIGRCWEAGGAPAYWPWVQSLRAYVHDSDTAALLGDGDRAASLYRLLVPYAACNAADYGPATPIPHFSPRRCRYW